MQAIGWLEKLRMTEFLFKNWYKDVIQEEVHEIFERTHSR